MPAISRLRPALIEWEYEMPEYSKCTMMTDFEKAFLRSGIGGQGWSAEEELHHIVASNSSIILHSNVVLVALPVPDFSMPFNVICFVTTTISLCFGPIHSFSTKILLSYRPMTSPFLFQKGSGKKLQLEDVSIYNDAIDWDEKASFTMRNNKRKKEWITSVLKWLGPDSEEGINAVIDKSLSGFFDEVIKQVYA
uniref:PRELI/MSF1 domain-containing protein n=1 Tax=Heterorhabditis bacteriophora TaxID=37862 RepID=A0A1I7XHL4_HETBA